MGGVLAVLALFVKSLASCAAVLLAIALIHHAVPHRCAQRDRVTAMLRDIMARLGGRV